MKRQNYFPSRVADQILWLENFRNKIAAHAATLGISVEECAAAIADARWLIYILGSWLPAKVAWQKACTDAVEQAQSGAGGGLMVLPVFVPPALPAAVGGLPAVVPVNEGALERIFAIVQVMKGAPGFNETNGTDLGIIGAAQGVPDMATIQPVFTVKTIGGHNFLDWGWDGNSAFLDQIQIQVDRGTGYADLTYDTTPGYTDTFPFPAVLTTWKYRAIYRVDDAQVGVWSAEMPITVGG